MNQMKKNMLYSFNKYLRACYGQSLEQGKRQKGYIIVSSQTASESSEPEYNCHNKEYCHLTVFLYCHHFIARNSFLHKLFHVISMRPL